MSTEQSPRYRIEGDLLITKLLCYNKEAKELTNNSQDYWLDFAIDLKEIRSLQACLDDEDNPYKHQTKLYVQIDDIGVFIVPIPFAEMLTIWQKYKDRIIQNEINNLLKQ